MTFDAGLQIGAANFGVGIDLRQFQRDLDQAEQLARARAQRIQQQLGNLQVRVRYVESGGRTRPTGGATGAAGAAEPGVPQNVRTQQTVTVERGFRIVGQPRLPEPELRPITVRQQVTIERHIEAVIWTNRQQLELGPGAPGLPSPVRVQVAEVPPVPPAQLPPPGGAGRPQLALPAPRQLALPPGPGDPYAEAFGGEPARTGGAVPVGGRQGTPSLRDLLFGGAFGGNAQWQAGRAGPADVTGRPFRTGGPGSADVGERAAANAERVASAAERAAGAGGGGRGGAGGGTGGEPGSLVNVLFGPEDSARRTQNLVRFGAALVGIPVGINLAAGAARELNRLIVEGINQATQLAQSAREVGIAFGSGASQLTVTGPQRWGTAAEVNQATAALGPLAQQYSLSTSQVQGLVRASQDLARMHGIEVPQAANVLQQVLQGNVQAGQQLGLTLTDENGRLRSVGLSFQELSDVVGRQAAQAQLLADVHQNVQRQLDNDRDHATTLSSSLDQLGRSWDALRTHLAQGATVPLTVAVEVANAVAQRPATAVTAGTPGGLQSIALQAIASAVGQRVPQAGATAAQVQQAVLDGLHAVFGSAPTTPAPEGGGYGGPGGPLASPGEAVDTARRAATPDMSRQLAMRDQQYYATAPPETTGQRVAREMTEATNRRNQAGLQMQVAQGRLDQIQYQSDQRRLGAAQQLADQQRTVLELQDEMAPALEREAELRDRMTIASRENLDLQRQQVLAQQAALPVTGQLSDLQFRATQAEQRAVVAATDVAAGRAPSYDINQQAQTLVDLYMNQMPRAQLAATEAQQQATVAGRNVQQWQYGQQLTQIGITGQQYQAQDQLIPLQAAQRTAQAQLDAANRALASADLADTPARTQAQAAVDAARLQVSNATADLARLQMEGAGVPDVTVNLTVPANTTVDQDLLDRITDAASSGTLSAIMQARQAVADRTPAGVAGGR